MYGSTGRGSRRGPRGKEKEDEDDDEEEEEEVGEDKERGEGAERDTVAISPRLLLLSPFSTLLPSSCIPSMGPRMRAGHRPSPNATPTLKF